MADLLARLEPGRSLRDAGGTAAPKLARRLLELGFIEPS
jgi:Fe2+ transport system protein FeoA